VLLQFGASLTDDASSVNYNHNMFITQATGLIVVKLYLKYLLNLSSKLQCLALQASAFITARDCNSKISNDIFSHLVN
jgi:hypothetical protein